MFAPIRTPLVSLTPEGPMTLISGPCVIDSEQTALDSAQALQKICAKWGVQLIYKSSFDKANRSSLSSFRGVGLEKGLKILSRVKQELELPILTDLHEPWQAEPLAAVVDILQIPAFLCRQTDLLIAAGQTGCIVNVKKGQFMAPQDMKHVQEKIFSTGNKHLILTERGSCFGYQRLVVDMGAIPTMQRLGVPVCFDASHSVQLPTQAGHESGGEPAFIPTLAKAALAAGADLLFIETHPNPKEAKSDRHAMLNYTDLDKLLGELLPLYTLIRTDA